ncbi:MAG: FkbM family methyltransferase [Actinomycetota bacterium]
MNPHWIDEAEIIARLAPAQVAGTTPVLVDVGANFGLVTARFLEMGWSVVAYEPDPVNREHFIRKIGAQSRVQLSSAAVSNTPAESMSLFTSPVSSGISTLTPFHESHEPAVQVQVVTLAEDLHARGVRNVDFLKVDIEGFDYFALKGFDWNYAPQFILYEFEDRKTLPLGHTLATSSAYVADQGYHLVYSVWEPIVEYGSQHRWRGLFAAPPMDIGACWGNVMCFRNEADAAVCLDKYGSRLRRFVDDLAHG